MIIVEVVLILFGYLGFLSCVSYKINLMEDCIGRINLDFSFLGYIIL